MSWQELLDAAAAAAYGEGYEDLTPGEQAIVRERTLPVMNVVLVRVREGIAQQLEYRAEMQHKNKSISAAKQLTYAAAKARAWPA
jgi:hypothetical protein